MNFLFVIQGGIFLSYIIIALFYRHSSSWFKMFYLLMGVLTFFISTQSINVVYNDTVSGNETLRGNLNMLGFNITNVSNIFSDTIWNRLLINTTTVNTTDLYVENIFGGSSPFNVWDSFSMNWETISETELNNTIINNGTAINLTLQNSTGFPNPKFDSGWFSINAGDKKLITHNVGGNVSNYNVIVYANSSTYGVNQINYGSRQLAYGVAGYRWEALNSTHIQVWRFVNDVSASELRVLIWEYDYSMAGTEIITLETNANDTDDFPRTAIYDNATIGNSDGNMTIDVDGSVTLEGDASKEDDLRFPSIAMKIGLVNPPGFNIFLNSTYVWLFDDKRNEQLFILGQMPHRRENGTDIDAHFHWTPVTADTGNVVWCIEYAWANIDETFINSTTQCILDSAVGTQYEHQMTPMIIMDGSNKNLSSAISARLYRDADNASDTYAFDAALVEFDFHYEIGSFGSDKI